MKKLMIALVLLSLISACRKENDDDVKIGPKKAEAPTAGQGGPKADEATPGRQVGSPPRSEEVPAGVVAKSDMSVDELVHAGELLISPENLPLAEKIIDLALEKDANHLKGQFYKKFLAQFAPLKGVIKRARPMVAQYGSLTDLDRETNLVPNSTTKTWLLDGQEDIKTSEDVQALLQAMIVAQKEFRSFLIRNANANLEVSLNLQSFERLLKTNTYGEGCALDGDWKARWEIKCAMQMIENRKLNSADLMVLRQSTAGQILQLSLANAYALDGVADLAKKDIYNETEMKEKIETLFANSKFGLLRAKENITLVKELGSDFATAFKWVVANSQTLCAESGQQRKRPGYAFDHGVCVRNSSKEQNDLKNLELALSGIVNVTMSTENGLKATQMNVIGFINNPVVDLRSLNPKTYSDKGCPVDFVDRTAGGLFPQADAQMFVRKTECQ